MNNLPYAKKEIILLSVLLLIYTFIAFFRLGSLNAPVSGWMPDKGDGVLIELSEKETIKFISTYSGTSGGMYNIEYSSDGTNWQSSKTLISAPFTWKRTLVNFEASAIKIIAETSDSILYEAGLWKIKDNWLYLLPVKNIISLTTNSQDKKNPKNLFDEQQLVPFIPSFFNSMYFDEVYHARTAFEHIHGLEPFEWTHPPLGKLFIAAGILIFGMNPFGWRIAGTICGILMILIFYIFARNIFKSRRYAFIAAFLLSVDFMHFTQSRIATIDVYAVFFIILMYLFAYQIYNQIHLIENWHKMLLPLFLCGLFFSLGVATKWICFYAESGIAIIFIISILDYFKKEKLNSKISFKKSSLQRKNIFTVIALTFCFFILLPSVIYFLSYIPTLFVKGHDLSSIWKYQLQMLKYHSELQATHPFSSKWWSWPLMLKPVWYYSGQQYLPTETISSIVSMGNPFIWWIGIAAIIISSIYGIKRKDKKILFILIGFLSQYIPWIFVQRLTFIYHFFASLPFMILFIVYTIEMLEKKFNNFKYFTYGYLLITFLAFILFYPILSGFPVSRGYVEILRWLDSWIFM